MKTAVCLSAIVACLTLFAQETPRPASGGLAERFKQLDRNGDGKLTVEELGSEWLRNPLSDSPYGLRGCRSIRPSPFPEEAGRVWYFCGFDQTGARGAGVTGPAAWIYKGTLPQFTKDAP